MPTSVNMYLIIKNINSVYLKYCDLSSQIPAMYIVEGLVEILIGKNRDLIKQKQDQEKEHE